MKITKLLFLCAILFATVSCNKDDDSFQEPPYTLTTTNFVDTYKLKFLEIKEVETVTFNNGSTSTSSSTTAGSVFQNANYVFNSDNTFSANGLYNTVKTVTNADGSVTVGETVIVLLDKEGTYTLNTTDKKLTLTVDGEGVKTFQIKEYTKTDMTLFSEETIEENNKTTVKTTEYRFSR